MLFGKLRARSWLGVRLRVPAWLGQVPFGKLRAWSWPAFVRVFLPAWRQVPFGNLSARVRMVLFDELRARVGRGG